MNKPTTKQEYIAFWESMKARMCFESPGIHSIFKEMTVQGQSGIGAPFKNEYDRMLHQYFNPSMPSFINYVGTDGTETIVYRDLP
jgi:hypothetical protein